MDLRRLIDFTLPLILMTFLCQIFSPRKVMYVYIFFYGAASSLTLVEKEGRWLLFLPSLLSPSLLFSLCLCLCLHPPPAFLPLSPSFSGMFCHSTTVSPDLVPGCGLGAIYVNYRVYPPPKATSSGQSFFKDIWQMRKWDQRDFPACSQWQLVLSASLSPSPPWHWLRK